MGGGKGEDQLANAVVTSVCHQQYRGVDAVDHVVFHSHVRRLGEGRHTAGPVHPSSVGRPRTFAGESDHDAVGSDHANGVVHRIRDEQIAVLIDGHAAGTCRQQGGGGGGGGDKSEG